MTTILISLIYCLAPAFVMWICRKVYLLGKLGPIMTLYVVGMIMGNTIDQDLMKTAQDVFSNAMIPLAIPLMLFSCVFKKSETRSQLLAMVTGLFAIVVTIVSGYFIFGVHIPEGAKLGGLLTGVYTGGTINLAALKTMLNVDEETYILINSYDIIVSTLYLTFLLTFGVKLFRKILPNETNPVNAHMSKKDRKLLETEIEKNNENPYIGIFSKEGVRNWAKALGVTLLICAISGGVAFLVPESAFMTVFILMLTTLGIGGSLVKKVHDLKYSYEVGMYFIYIFCIVIASMADFSEIKLFESLNLLGYLLFAVFGSLVLQIVLAKIFKIDSDTTVITSVTFINSPPFVPLIAASMKNKNVLMAGLSIGVIGYAIGNYLGFLIAEFLKMIA